MNDPARFDAISFWMGLSFGVLALLLIQLMIRVVKWLQPVDSFGGLGQDTIVGGGGNDTIGGGAGPDILAPEPRKTGVFRD